jgi:arylsulfatase A-like enzyme
MITNINNKKTLTSFVFFVMFGGIAAQQRDVVNQKPNILFIAVDDLRPELGCYGKTHIHSPNIDALAKSGLTFNRAYCNIPICGASRASILSGIRPNRDRFLDFDCYQDKDVPGVFSIPMYLRNNGYYTVSLGKVYHHYVNDGKGSWSETPWAPQDDYILPESLAQRIPHPRNPNALRGPAFEAPDVSDHVYKDGMIANEAVSRLRQLKNIPQSFFLAVGFNKPHLPFNAPKKYWDLYDFDKIRLPYNMNKPIGAPDDCMHNFGELRNYSKVPRTGQLNDELMRRLIHGYYASVSYVDAQIGKVLNELKQLGLDKNTIVILWGDHGWFLGDHNLWCKHSNLEKALHTTLIVHAPGFIENSKSDALVEFVDVYPTICELTGLKKPIHLQGKSFLPLLKNPDQAWKSEVFCRWVRGETIITKTHSYTEWLDDDNKQVTARMLFDLSSDPEETTNISEKPENSMLISNFSETLKAHIKNRDMLVLP